METKPSHFATIKSILSKSFAYTNDNLATFASFFIFTFGALAIIVVFLIPMLYSALSISTAQFSWFTFFMNMFMFVLNILAMSIFSSIVTLKAKSSYIGKYQRTEEAFSTTMRLLLPIMGITFVLTILVNIGFMIFIVPGIIAIMFFCLVIPVRIFERTSFVKTFSRSISITLNNLTTLVGIVLIPLICYLIATFIGLIVYSSSNMYGTILLVMIFGYWWSYMFTTFSVTYLELEYEPEESVDA